METISEKFHNFRVHNLALKKEVISEFFLSKLLGRVFHFTTHTGWKKIQASGYIDINQKGMHGNTSIHSSKSMGRHLGAVCLFDLRGKKKEVLHKDGIFFDFFERRWRKEPSYFLMLSESSLSTLTTIDQLNPQLQNEMMYIPEIESWHVGNLPLRQLEAVYQVQAL